MTSQSCVLFDMDGTLFDESTFVTAGFRAAAQLIAPHANASVDAVVDGFVRIAAADGRGQVFDTFLKRTGLPVTWVPALINAYRSIEPELSLLPEALAVLTELRHRNVPTGVVTDGYGLVQGTKARSLGLYELVDVVICTDTLGPEATKPSSAGFEAALLVTNSRTSGSVYVGNDIRKDFIGPNKLGMRSILVTKHLLGEPDREPEKAQPDDTIQDLGELLDLLTT